MLSLSNQKKRKVFAKTIDFFDKIAYNNNAKRGRFGAIFVIAKPMTSNVRLGEC